MAAYLKISCNISNTCIFVLQ